MAWTIETESADWASEATVDEAKGIVSNLAICGLTSKNGYDFAPDAWGSLEACKALYEGKHACIDHLPEEKMNRAANRSFKDVAGVFRDVVLRNGRPYGSVHTEGCPQGPLFIQAVKAKIPNVGLSHVALYKFNRTKTRVEQVQKIATVDLVINPATTKSFSEQSKEDEDMTEKTIELLEKQLAEEKTGRALDVKTRDEQIVTLKGEATKSAESLKAMTAERDTLNAKVVRFESEQTMNARKAKIASQMADAKLDAKLCPEALQAAWLGIADDAERNTQIVAWKDSVAGIQKNKPISRERQEGGGETAEYSPEQDLKRAFASV
jgi:hypothetical protein